MFYVQRKTTNAGVSVGANAVGADELTPAPLDANGGGMHRAEAQQSELSRSELCEDGEQDRLLYEFP